jgi:serine/threonine-protein kinase
MYATEPALPEAPKTLRGKYLLEDRLGEGGMAVVWRARHLLVERTVAIKMLRPEVARLPNVPQRFVQEARAAWLIDHPNVVSVLDVDVDDDGTPFIVQELLDGEDLEAHLARVGPLSPAALVALVAPALDALAAAHARGVIHRDLKPSNVFLSRTSRGLMPKLLDFGISRIASDDTRMTSTGVVMGTPAYMAPEQVHSPKKVDARADLWAFGVMCYELLSGKLPFEGESSGELLVKLCTADPKPLCESVRGVPLALETLVMSCLRRDPAARPASAAVLHEQLRALEANGSLAVTMTDDISTAATYIGHRPDLPMGAAATAMDAASMVVTAPANDGAAPSTRGPANDDVPTPSATHDPNAPANDDARAAVTTTPMLLASPPRRRGVWIALVALVALGAAAAAWQMSAAPRALPPAVAPTLVVVRVPSPAPSPTPAAQITAPITAPTPARAATTPPVVPMAQHSRRGRHDHATRPEPTPTAPTAPTVATSPTAPPTPVAAAIVPPGPPPEAPVARPPTPVRTQPEATPAPDRRVRYTTDYGH